MAMKTLRWMEGELVTSDYNKPTTDIDSSRHDFTSWPWNSSKETSVLLLRELEEDMQTRSSMCRVDRYVGVPERGGCAPCWQLERKAESATDLQKLLSRDRIIRSEAGENDVALTTFYLVTQRSAQVTRILGYYLDLPPRFFDPSYVIYNVSPKFEKSFAHFKIQFIEKKETENRDLEHNLPIAFNNGSWRFTDVALICASRPRHNEFDAVCLLNPEDDTIAEAFHRLLSMTNERHSSPTDSNLSLVIELANELFRIIALNWGFFLDDAESHVTYISSQCIGPQRLSTEDQLHFTRELHQLTPVWGQVSRRLSAARNVIDALRDHPFYQGTDHSERNFEFLLKFRSTIDEHQERTKALREQTSALISLVLNIALLNESTAAIQESRASNDLALRVHRITIITFIFFPLSLSMVSFLYALRSLNRKSTHITQSVFSMNVQQMTGNLANPDISVFVILAIGLITVTALLWLLWYLLDRRRRKATGN
jgi:hypothetical protein